MAAGSRLKALADEREAVQLQTSGERRWGEGGVDKKNDYDGRGGRSLSSPKKLRQCLETSTHGGGSGAAGITRSSPGSGGPSPARPAGGRARTG